MSMQTSTATPLAWRPIELRRRVADNQYSAILVPFGEVTRLTEYGEMGERFNYGAFADWLHRNGHASISLTASHQGPRIGQVDDLAEQADGLTGVIKLDHSHAGFQAARLIENGDVGLSIGFVTRADKRDPDGTRVVYAADIDHLALVGKQGAYQGARIITGTNGKGSPLVLGREARQVLPGYQVEPWPARWA